MYDCRKVVAKVMQYWQRILLLASYKQPTVSAFLRSTASPRMRFMNSGG
jgi:hypothetical protein